MKESISRSRHKIFLVIFIAVIPLLVLFIIFSSSIIFEGTFLDIKQIIEKDMEEALDKEVSIETIYFLPYPYRELILCNIRIYDREDVDYIYIKRCNIRFKLLPFLIDRTIVINREIFIEPTFFPPSKDLRIGEDKEETPPRRKGYKLKLDKSFLVKVKSGKIISTSTHSASVLDKISFDFWIKFEEGERMRSEGWVDFKESRFKNYLFNNVFFFGFVNKIGYKLKTSLRGDTISVDDLLFDFEQFKIGINGLIENCFTEPVLNLKLSLIKLNLPEKVSLKSRLFVDGIRNLIVHVKGALQEPYWSIRLDRLRTKFAFLPTVVNIDYFYCDLRLADEGFFIDQCYFFLNNFPIGLRGRLYNFESPHMELNLISYPGQLPSLRSLNPLNFEFSFTSRKHGDSFKGKTSFEIVKLVSVLPRKTQSFKFTINDLLYKFLEEEAYSTTEIAVPLLINAKGIVCEADTLKRKMKLQFEDFRSTICPDGSKVYFKDLNLSGYKGFLKGKGFFELERLPPTLFLDFLINKVSMAEFTKLLHLDFDLAGDLSGEGVFDTRSHSYFIGKAGISNGYIKNLKLLDLIANFLSIVSLKDIYFDDFSADFSFSVIGDKASFDKIRLRSRNIYLDAGFSLINKYRINGNIFVRLPVKLLRESFKLKLLFFLMREKFSYVDFEFKIGGLARSPHIKWLDTKFKQSLSRFLSKKGKVNMEKKIEEALKPLLRANR